MRCLALFVSCVPRVSVEEALAHPYLEQLHFPDDEPCGPKISKHEFDFERYPKKQRTRETCTPLWRPIS